jgi:hypothetical protein
MPFYDLNELEKKKSSVNKNIESGAVPGEFMKFGVVTKPEGEGPPLHEHPNEEQFSLVISGQMHFVLGDEDRRGRARNTHTHPEEYAPSLAPGQRPRYVRHHQESLRQRRPAQDYNLRPEAKEIEKLYPGKVKA